jgi:hypothetical protein
MAPVSERGRIAGMDRRIRTFGAGIAILLAALAVSSLASAAPQVRAASVASYALTPDLGAVRDRVESWLSTQGFASFKVSEVMAFTNNDYVAVSDGKGKPAFELLYTPRASWLMEEPVSMMWNTRYGMMGGFAETAGSGPLWGMMGGGGMMGGWNGWYGGGSGKVTTLAQAVEVANSWLAQYRGAKRAESDGRAFPGYYTLDTTRNGKTAGMLSVNATTGAVWYHGWHGAFVAERMF